MLDRSEIEKILSRLETVQSVKVLEVDEEKLALCQTALELMDKLEAEKECGSEDVS